MVTTWNRYYFKPEFDYDKFARKHITSPTDAYKKEFRNELLEMIANYGQYDYALSRAKNINAKVQEIAYTANIALDLYTDAYAIDYLYCPKYAKKQAAYLGFKDTILVDNNFTGALDEAIFYPWWLLQQAFNKLGRKEDV